MRDTLGLAGKTSTAGTLRLMENQMHRDSSVALWQYHSFSYSAEERNRQRARSQILKSPGAQALPYLP